jgi:hypothetical protein
MTSDGWVPYVLVALFVIVVLPFGLMLLAAPRRRRPARPGEPLSAVEIWNRADRRLGRIESASTEFTGDVGLVLRRPLLVDPGAPTTARFRSALEQARTLRTGARDRAAGVRFAEAVDRVARAWRDAYDTAERVGLSRLEPADRAAVEEVVDLIRVADSTDRPDAERAAAGDRARDRVAELSAAGTVRMTGLADWSLQHEVGNPHPFPLTG